MTCGHRSACLVGMTIGGTASPSRRLWWCHICGALGEQDGHHGRPSMGSFHGPYGKANPLTRRVRDENIALKRGIKLLSVALEKWLESMEVKA